MKKMLFVNVGGSITDRRTWSGIPFSLYAEMSKLYEIETCEINLSKSFFDMVSIFFRRYILRQSVDWKFTRRFAKKASRILNDKINSMSEKPDVIFAIGSAGIAYVSTDIPIVYFSDAVLSCMINYYYFGFKDAEVKEYNEVQKNALDNSSVIVLTSEWAKNAAVNDYGISADKVKVMHFGSNMDSEVTPRAHDGINLLFVGADLVRKGAKIAIDAVTKANEMDGSNHYSLHIVGGKLEDEDVKNNQYVKQYGFINRNDDSQRKLLEDLRSKSDIFILPTKAECAGIVFGEACACGLPSLSFRTGGVGDYIRDGYTGYLFDLNDGADKYAEKIVELANNTQLLEKMKINSRKLFEEDLNWEHLAVSISNEISALIGG